MCDSIALSRKTHKPGRKETVVDILDYDQHSIVSEFVERYFESVQKTEDVPSGYARSWRISIVDPLKRQAPVDLRVTQICTLVNWLYSERHHSESVLADLRSEKHPPGYVRSDQFISWCSETTYQLQIVNLENVYNKLVGLPKVSGSGTKALDKNVEVKY